MKSRWVVLSKSSCPTLATNIGYKLSARRDRCEPLARGQPPSEQLIDQLRYLRQLGVPFRKAELGAGAAIASATGLII